MRAMIRALAAALALALPGPALAKGRAIASINMCTDQLLLDLADPGDIAGLSPYAHGERSFARDKARGLPRLSGTGEELLIGRPAIVLAGAYMKRDTLNMIQRNGLRVETFTPARSFAEVEEQMRRVGALAGQEARAAARISQLRAAVALVRAASARRNIVVLPLQRRGWVSGSDSLTTELLDTAGLVNGADALGLRYGGMGKLEAIVALAPDAILIGRDDPEPEDQGRAFLHHPALARLFPPGRRLVLPESLTVCGGPMLVEALDRLAGQISRLHPRAAAGPASSR